MNEFGQKIKKIRKDRGLTQQEFADSLGYAHKSTINKIESGLEDMSYQKILLLIKEYMLDAKELFDNPEEEIGKIDELMEKSKKPKHDACIVYIHGLYGSSGESSFYDFLSSKYDVLGLDYADGNPWEVKDSLIYEFLELTKGYKEIYVIGNSIGAFYAYHYLATYRIKAAFFISPVTNMKSLIEGLMEKHRISLDKLEEERFIPLSDGRTLSYDFYLSLGEEIWNVKTHILYGEKDKVVSQESLIEFVTNHHCSLSIMKNGEHYFHTPRQLNYIRKWITEYL